MVTPSTPYKHYSPNSVSAKQRKQRALSWALKRTMGAQAHMGNLAISELSVGLLQQVKQFETSRKVLVSLLREELKNL